MQRKLGMATDLRMAVLKNQVSNLLWFGKIETTIDAAKEIRRIAEKLITVAVKSYQDTVEVTKKGKKMELVGKGKEKKLTEVEIEINSINDGAQKLAARRKLMSSLNDLQEIKGRKENRTEYRMRTKGVNHPLIEKMFNDLAPKYADRAKELGQGGGYTRIMKKGPRRGDNAEMAIIELV